MQEIVFIGKDLNHEMIQTSLDNCLLNEEEMQMGPRMWQEAWYDTDDKIRLPTKLFLDDNVVKVEALEVQDEYEDKPSMVSVEVYEDKDMGELNTVSISTVTPQVATEFEYNGNNN